MEESDSGTSYDYDGDDDYDNINGHLHRLVFPNEPMYKDGYVENFDYMQARRNKIATRSLMAELNTFENWELLPMEIRSMIAGKMDFMTRLSFMLSSSSNCEISRSVPMIIDTIFVCEDAERIAGRIEPDEKHVCVYLTNTNTFARFWFVESGNDTKVIKRYWLEPGAIGSAWTSMVLENSNYLKESELFVERLLVLTNYKVKKFRIKILDFGKNLTFFDRVEVKKEIIAFSSDIDYTIRFLNCANSSLNKVEVFAETRFNSPNFANHITIQSAKKLKITTRTSFTEADVLGLNCEEFMIRGVDISNNSINIFMRRWINGGGAERFRRADFRLPRTINRREILENIDVFRWDQRFEDENRALKNWVMRKFPGMRYYYIESRGRNNGATLGIGRNRVVFLVTGKR